MSTVHRPALKDRQKFLANRSAFPLEELARHAGQWIAWSPDGSRIVAHARDLEALDGLVFKAGVDPEECVLEGIPAEDAVIGGGSLGQIQS
jgi:hypothetical protein